MSKAAYNAPAPPVRRLGDWLRTLREERGLTLREVADAVETDLAHLQKIEHGQRVPTDEQIIRLAKFFRLDETEAKAQRIAERFRQEFDDDPARQKAVSILAQEAGIYRADARVAEVDGQSGES